MIGLRTKSLSPMSCRIKTSSPQALPLENDGSTKGALLYRCFVPGESRVDHFPGGAQTWLSSGRLQTRRVFLRDNYTHHRRPFSVRATVSHKSSRRSAATRQTDHQLFVLVLQSGTMTFPSLPTPPKASSSSQQPTKQASSPNRAPAADFWQIVWNLRTDQVKISFGSISETALKCRQSSLPFTR